MKNITKCMQPAASDDWGEFIVSDDESPLNAQKHFLIHSLMKSESASDRRKVVPVIRKAKVILFGTDDKPLPEDSTAIPGTLHFTGHPRDQAIFNLITANAARACYVYQKRFSGQEPDKQIIAWSEKIIQFFQPECLALRMVETQSDLVPVDLKNNAFRASMTSMGFRKEDSPVVLEVPKVNQKTKAVYAYLILMRTRGTAFG